MWVGNKKNRQKLSKIIRNEISRILLSTYFFFFSVLSIFIFFFTTHHYEHVKSTSSLECTWFISCPYQYFHNFFSHSYSYFFEMKNKKNFFSCINGRQTTSIEKMKTFNVSLYSVYTARWEIGWKWMQIFTKYQFILWCYI